MTGFSAALHFPLKRLKFFFFFNVTIYRNLAAEITTNYDTRLLNGRIRTLFLRKSWTIN